MRPDIDCRWPRSYPAGERLRPAAPDPRPHPALLGARALDGERAFDNSHHLVGAISLAQRPALDAVPVSLAALRAPDSLPRRYVAQRTHLLLVARSALLRVDVAAHHALRNRRDHKIAAISRLLRCLLSYLQPGNAWEQSVAADVGLI